MKKSRKLKILKSNGVKPSPKPKEYLEINGQTCEKDKLKTLLTLLLVEHSGPLQRILDKQPENEDKANFTSITYLPCVYNTGVHDLFRLLHIKKAMPKSQHMVEVVLNFHLKIGKLSRLIVINTNDLYGLAFVEFEEKDLKNYEDHAKKTIMVDLAKRIITPQNTTQRGHRK